MICILALSAIADDPRVRRQGEGFHRAGRRVVAAGPRGARSAPDIRPGAGALLPVGGKSKIKHLLKGAIALKQQERTAMPPWAARSSRFDGTAR
jgi:hypothetical protein